MKISKLNQKIRLEIIKNKKLNTKSIKSMNSLIKKRIILRNNKNFLKKIIKNLDGRKMEKTIKKRYPLLENLTLKVPKDTKITIKMLKKALEVLRKKIIKMDLTTLKTLRIEKLNHKIFNFFLFLT